MCLWAAYSLQRKLMMGKYATGLQSGALRVNKHAADVGACIEHALRHRTRNTISPHALCQTAFGFCCSYAQHATCGRGTYFMPTTGYSRNGDASKCGHTGGHPLILDGMLLGALLPRPLHAFCCRISHYAPEMCGADLQTIRFSDEAECDSSEAGAKPVLQADSYTEPCEMYRWAASAWSSCIELCGREHKRQVTCMCAIYHSRDVQQSCMHRVQSCQSPAELHQYTAKLSCCRS